MELVPAPDVRLVLVTAPPGVGHDLARDLVERGLAACVNVVPGLRSIYRWEGALRDDPESLLLVKTSAAGLTPLTQALAELHPYEVPEALVFVPTASTAAYLAWLTASVGAAPPAVQPRPLPGR